MTDAFRAHMQVTGSDGRTVGSIARIVGRHIELAGQSMPQIPLIWVAGVEGDVVRLDRTAAQAWAGSPQPA
jgi:hypothetical protein